MVAVPIRCGSGFEPTSCLDAIRDCRLWLRSTESTINPIIAKIQRMMKPVSQLFFRVVSYSDADAVKGVAVVVMVVV